MPEVEDQLTMIEQISAAYRIDKIRDQIKELGYEPTDLNVIKFSQANLGKARFEIDFAKSDDEKTQEIADLALEYGKKGYAVLTGAPVGPTSNRLVNYVSEKIAKSFGIPTSGGTQDIDFAVALRNNKAILAAAVEGDEAYEYDASGNWFIEGLKDIDQTGVLVPALTELTGGAIDPKKRAIAETLNMLITPETEDENGNKIPNPHYDKRVGNLVQHKFINYVQNNWERLGENVVGLVAQAPMFAVAGGAGAKVANKSVQFLAKALDRALKLKNGNVFTNALRAVAVAGETGLYPNILAKGTRDGKYLFGLGKESVARFAAHTIQHTQRDALMFGIMGLPRGEDVRHSLAAGAMFGLAGSIGSSVGGTIGTAIKQAGKGITKPLAWTVNQVIGHGTTGFTFASGSALISGAMGEDFSWSDAALEFSTGAALSMVNRSTRFMQTWGGKETRKRKVDKELSKKVTTFNKILQQAQDDPAVANLLREAEELRIKETLGFNKPPVEEGRQEGGRPIPPITAAAGEAERIAEAATREKQEAAIKRGPVEGNTVGVELEPLDVKESGYSAASRDVVDSGGVGLRGARALVDYVARSINNLAFEMKKPDRNEGLIRVKREEIEKRLAGIERILTSDENFVKLPNEERQIEFSTNLEELRRRYDAVSGWQFVPPIESVEAAEKAAKRINEVIAQGLDVTGKEEREFHELIKSVHGDVGSAIKENWELGYITYDPKTNRLVFDLDKIKASRDKINEIKGVQSALEHMLTKADVDKTARGVSESWETFDKSRKLQEISQLIKHIEEKNALPSKELQRLREQANPALTDNEMDRLYLQVRYHSLHADKILQVKNLKELERQFRGVSDGAEEEAHRGYVAFFKHMGDKFQELHISESPIKVTNKLLNLIEEANTRDEYLEKVREYGVEWGKTDNRISTVVGDLTGENVRLLNGLFRFKKSFKPYNDKNMNNKVLYYDAQAGFLKSKDIQEVDPYDVGELTSPINSILGPRVTKVVFTTQGNRSKEVTPVDFAALKPEQQRDFMLKMYERGFFPLYTGGAKPTMYFVQRHLNTRMPEGSEKDPKEHFRGAIEKDMGKSFLAELDQMAKKDQYFDGDYRYYEHAYNVHNYLTELFGEGYYEREVVKGNLNNVNDMVKRFQIPTSDGEVLLPGELRGDAGDMLKGRILADESDVWKIYGDKSFTLPEVATDGALIMSQDVYDRYSELMGAPASADAIKAFWHDVNNAFGAIGLKMAVFKATKKQQKFLKENGLDFVTFESSAKYKGSRKVGEDFDIDVTKLVYKFAEHIDENILRNSTEIGPDSKVYRSKVLLPKQFNNDIAIYPEEKDSYKVYNELQREYAETYDKLHREWIDALSSPVRFGAFVDKVMNLAKKREAVEGDRYDRMDISDMSAATSAVEKLLLIMDESYFAQSIPWVKDHVRRAISGYFFDRLARPEVDGYNGVLRESSEVYQNLTDDTFIAGEKARHLAIPVGTYSSGKMQGKAAYEKLGDVYDTYEFLKKLGKFDELKPLSRLMHDGQPVWKLLTAQLPHLRDSMRFKSIRDLGEAMRMILVRTPMENIAGARALRFAGFAGEGTGAQIMVNKKNMNALGGADVDIDKVTVMPAGNKQYLYDYVEKHKDWTQPKEGEISVDQQIKNYADSKVDKSPALKRKTSIYDIGSQVEAITSTINSKANLEKVAGLKKVMTIAQAHGLDLWSEIDVGRLPQNTVLSRGFTPNPNQPYSIAIVGSKMIEKLTGDSFEEGVYSGESYEMIKQYLTEALSMAQSKTKGNLEVFTSLERGVNEIVATVARELGITVKYVQTGADVRDRDRAIDHDNLAAYSSGDVITKKGLNRYKKYNPLVEAAKELWTFDIDRMSSDYTTATTNAIKHAKELQTVHVDLIKNRLRGKENFKPTKLDFDKTFQFYIRYAADAVKYGGMENWNVIEGQIYGQLYGLNNRFDQLLFRNKVKSPAESKLGLIRDMLTATERGLEPETRTPISNGKVQEILQRYKYVFKQPATGMEWGLFNTMDTDNSLTRMIDKEKLMKNLYESQLSNVPKGRIKYYEFLADNRLTSDALINTEGFKNVEVKVEGFLGLYKADKNGKPDQALLEIAKRIPDIPLMDSEGNIIPHEALAGHLAEYFKENPGKFVAELRRLKDKAEDFIFKDINNHVSQQMYREYRSEIFKHYGKHKREQAEAEVAKIDDTVYSLRSQFKALFSPELDITKLERMEMLDELKARLAEEAYINPSDPRTQYFWLQMMAAQGRRGTSDERTSFSGDFPKLAYYMDYIPVSFVREYKRRADEFVNTIASESSVHLRMDLTGGIASIVTQGINAVRKLHTPSGEGHRETSGYKRGVNRIMQFVGRWNDIPEIARGRMNIEEWFQSVVGRPTNTIKDIPISKDEMTKLIDSMYVIQLGEKTYNALQSGSPDGVKLAKKFDQARTNFMMYSFLPSAVLARTAPGRELWHDLSNEVGRTESARTHLFSKLQQIDAFLEAEVERRSQKHRLEHGREFTKNERINARKDVDQTFRLLNERPKDGGIERSQIDTDSPILSALHVWEGPVEIAGRKPGPDEYREDVKSLMWQIMQETREKRMDYITRLIRRQAMSRHWGAKFLKADLDEIVNMSELKYVSLIENAIERIYELNSEIPWRAKYYPRRANNEDMIKEQAWLQVQEIEAWKYLRDEGKMDEETLKAVLTRVPESGHTREREDRSHEFLEDTNVFNDFSGLIESVVHPWNRVKILEAAEKALVELKIQEMKDPKAKPMAQAYIKYVESLIEHSLHGSRGDDVSLTKDIMTGMTNITFGTLIGLNMGSSIRNAAQKTYAWMQVSGDIRQGVKKWESGIPMALDENGNKLGDFNEVKAQFGIDYGLTQQIVSDIIEQTVSSKLKTVKIEHEIMVNENQIEDLKFRYGTEQITKDQYDFSVAQRKKNIARLEKDLKKQDFSDKYILETTRKFAEKTGERGLLAIADVLTKPLDWVGLEKYSTKNIEKNKLAFQVIEQGNRLYAAKLGYYQAYRNAERQFKEVMGRNVDKVKMHQQAHKAGLEGARALVNLTQYEYHGFNAPAMMRTPGQKAFFQFRSFTWNWLNMNWQTMRKGYQAFKYGGDRKWTGAAFKTILLMGLIAGAQELMGLQGIDNYFATEPIDKGLQLIDLLSRDENAAYGKGWAGFISSVPGAPFQPLIDAAWVAIGSRRKYDSVWGKRDAWEMNLKKKYGIFAGDFSKEFVLGNAWMGYTSQKIAYELLREGKLNYVDTAISTIFGIRGKDFWPDRKKKKRRKPVF